MSNQPPKEWTPRHKLDKEATSVNILYNSKYKEEANPHFPSDSDKVTEEENLVIPSAVGIGESDADSEVQENIRVEKWHPIRILTGIVNLIKPRSPSAPSEEDIIQVREVKETKYPKILTILEHPGFDKLITISAFLSFHLLLFSEGFILESSLLWGLVHSVNTIYTFGIFSQWLHVYLRSKYAKTNQEYSNKDIVLSLISVIPFDVIFLIIYNLNDKSAEGFKNPTTFWLSVSKFNYFIRIRSVFKYFSKLEDQLSMGDLKLVVAKIFLYTILLIHFAACFWHRIGCERFVWSNFLMSPKQATYYVCYENSWVIQLINTDTSPFLRLEFHVLLEHYLTSLYWAHVICFRLGSSEIPASLVSDWEVAFSSITQIMAWIFVIAYVSGSLTSLLVEIDTERENFLTRRYAIDKYLDFSFVTAKIHSDVNRFYDYFWARSKGIHNWDMVKDMPLTMKADIYYDINKFVLDQLPIMSSLDQRFLMSLSVQMKHCFYLKGEILYKMGEIGSALFYVINGHLEIMSSDGSSVLAEIRSGSAIGEHYLVQASRHEATVRCGSECDIMVLNKQDFKNALQFYPEIQATLQQKLDKRFEQAGLLLNLCENTNEYPKACNKLKDLKLLVPRPSGLAHRQSSSSSIATEGLDDTRENVLHKDQIELEDYDGLTISSESQKLIKISSALTKQRQINEEAEAAALLALEGDLARAAALAKGLNIPRPPLTVTAPNKVHLYYASAAKSSSVERRFFASKLLPNISEVTEERSVCFFLWKLSITLSYILIFWYYTYAFAFGNHSYKNMDYIAHFFDLLFLADFVLDMFLTVVVLPHKSLEETREIFAYNVKTYYFWIRLFAFLPIEYILSPIAGMTRASSHFYYILKFNRIIFQYYEGIKFFTSFDGDSRISPVLLFIVVFCIRLFFMIHILGCVFEVVLKENKNTMITIQVLKIPELSDSALRFYEFVIYWGTQVVTGTGYGDIKLRNNYEIVLTAIGVFMGISLIIYLNARVSAIMVNAERRRVAFKQSFYCLKDFMVHRKFSKWLSRKVVIYYELQWKAHEGVLIPSHQSAIWDAPKTLFEKVCLSQAKKYIERIPVFKYCNEALILEICTCLRQYIVPPNEVILYPSDRIRNLYIIVKGYCQIFYHHKPIGKLGEGNYIGLPGLVYGCNKPVKVTTLTSCQFFCLEFEDFVKIAKKFPKFLFEFKILRGDAKLGLERSIHIRKHENEIPLPAPNKEGNINIKLFLNSTLDIEQDVCNSSEMDHLKNKNVFKSFMYQKKLHGFSFCLPWSILPQGRFLKWWTVFRVICALCVGSFAPIQVSFSVEPITSFYFMLVFDIIAWIDIYLCFHIAYFGADTELKTDRKKTVLNYLKGPFLLDLIGCFPLDYLVIICNPAIVAHGPKQNYNNIYHIVSACRLNRMIQIYRIFVCGKILEQSIFWSLSFITLLQVVPLMFLFINVVTCLAVYIVCGSSHNGEPIACDKNAWITTETLFTDQMQPEIVLVNPWLSYIVGIYWVTISAFAVGFGDIGVVFSPTNRKIAIAIMFSGCLVVGYLVSKLTACLVGEDSRRIVIRDKTKILFRFMKEFKVPKELQRRVKESVFAEWDKTKGIYPQDLFSALPPSLKSDAFSGLYEVKLRQSPLFKTLDQPGIRILSSILTETVFPVGEFVFKFGDLNSDVFFVAKGIVVGYTKHGEIINYMGPGSLVGGISALLNIQRVFTAVAATDLELFIFSKEDFFDFLNLYPSLQKTFSDVCVYHYKLTMEAIAKKSSRSVNIRDLTLTSNRKEFTSEELQNLIVKSKERFTILNIDKEELPLPQDPIPTFNIGTSEVKLTQSECEEEDDFINDPLRIAPIKEQTVEQEEDFKSSRRSFSEKVSRKQRYISWFITFSRIPKDEMGLLHLIQEKNKFTLLNFVIHPASSLYSYSSFFLFLTSISCGLCAYEIAFATKEKEETAKLFVPRVCLDVFFVGRIFGNFHLAYYKPNGKLVTDIKKIIKRYTTSYNGLGLDLLTTLPFYLFSFFSPHSNADLSAKIRSVQLLRLFYMPSYMKETKSDIRTRSSVIKIGKFSILLCLIFHFYACAWYWVACDGLDCRNYSWMDTLLKNLIENAKIQKETDISITSRYLLSVSYVVTAITFTGLNDITPGTGLELGLTIIMIFITVFVIGFLVGEMTQCLASQVASKTHYRHKLHVMEHHFHTLGLSPSRVEEVRRYFRLLWTRCNGISYTSLLAELPYPLRADIKMNVYGPNIKHSRLLGKKDDTIIRQWSARIRHEIYMPGAHIVRSGDVCVAVYFIKKGEVVVLDDNTKDVPLCIEVLYENECFGEVKVIQPGDQFRFSYVARLETELGVLFHNDLKEVALQSPGVYEDLVQKAIVVKQQRLMKSKQEEIDCIGKSCSTLADITKI